ncbi:MAG: transglycosylase SLT domain-containing protein [Flavobacteriales bacterium]|nr:transglycosylase SLT domain-containing protein [Flavobacteriales bacterium]
MKKILLYLLFPLSIYSQENYIIDFYGLDSVNYAFVNTNALVKERWDILAQPNFWKEVMVLSQDSCLVNIAATREVLGKDSFVKWKAQTEDQKLAYKDSVRKVFNLDSTEKIYVTSGKSHFYQFEKVIPSISKAIPIFKKYDTDPWYAQAILLIESPGKIEYSNVGAYGPFQLMKSVARSHGLIVNKTVDERKDFEKSAMGAASLLRKTCIPEAKRILKKNQISYSEDAIWFKLFVLHIYHAGAGNVDGLVSSFKEKVNGQELITKMWHSEWGGFKNASQNYSQVALAAMLNLHDFIYSNCSVLYSCDIKEL